jgi:hypothetical protein
MGQISSRLSSVRESHTHLFGGLHIVFAGDLYQLPPVRASPLFTPVQNYKVSPGGLTLSGHAIWQNELNACILLQESVRFVQDPTWGKINEEIRQGHWTKEIVDAINTRYIDNPDERAKCLEDLLLDTSDYIPIVVTSNRDRVKYNNHMIALSIEKLPPSNKAVRLAAVVKISTRSCQKFYTKRDLKMIYAMSSEQTKNLQVTLDLFVGMPVQIPKNVCTEKGVANGVIGFVTGFQYTDNDSGEEVVFRKSGDGLHIPSQDVEIVFVKIPDNKHFFFDGLPAGVVPLVKKKDYVSFQRNNRRYSFSIEQFPIVPAFALTVFKTQGLTLNRMIIGSWGMAKKARRPPKASAYVMLSRVCEMKSLILLEKLNFHDTGYFKPPLELVSEIERLEELQKSTISELDATLVLGEVPIDE